MARTPDITSAPPLPKPGRRERNRQAKLKLIRDTARRLFIANGYDATTLRAIADEADVGFGTVFGYASDKAGLLAMVFVEELETLPPLFPEESSPEADLLDALVAGLEPLYRFWASTPTLSGHVLQQMEFYADNPHGDLIVARRAQAKDELRRWIVREQAAGRVVRDVEAADAADTLFAIYTSAIREWSATTPADPDTGLARLRTLMALLVRALTPVRRRGTG